MSSIKLNDSKQKPSRVPAFLLANYNWIKTYYEYRSAMLGTQKCVDQGTYGNKLKFSEMNYKEICYGRAYDDFKCTFGISYIAQDNPIYDELGNRAWLEIKKNVYLRKNIKVMERVEYSAFLLNPAEFLRSTCLKRLYRENVDDKVLKDSFEKFHKLNLEENRVIDSLTKLGRIYVSTLIISAPLDFIADFLRGTKELLMDLHSVPDYVANVCKVITELVILQAENYRKCYNMNHLILPLHLPAILSRRDFERFYYPEFKVLVDALIQKGYKILILFEGNVDRFIDIISNIDSEQVIIHFESTNIDEYQEYFKGNGTYISGFYPSYLLKYGTSEECLTKARELKEKVAGNDRYIFSTNKALISSEDVNYNNILKVYDYFST